MRKIKATNMRRLRYRVILAATVGALAAFTLVPVLADSSTSRVSPPLFQGEVIVSFAEHGEGLNTIAAFVPTGSTGPCQLTLAESNFAVPGTTAFCGVRELDGVPGLFVHIFLPVEAPPNALWQVNLYQEFAKAYGEPVPAGGI